MLKVRFLYIILIIENITKLQNNIFFFTFLNVQIEKLQRLIVLLTWAAVLFLLNKLTEMEDRSGPTTIGVNREVSVYHGKSIVTGCNRVFVLW